METTNKNGEYGKFAVSQDTAILATLYSKLEELDTLVYDDMNNGESSDTQGEFEATFERLKELTARMIGENVTGNLHIGRCDNSGVSLI